MDLRKDSSGHCKSFEIEITCLRLIRMTSMGYIPTGLLVLSSSHSENCLIQEQRAMLVTILWRELEGAASEPVGSMHVSISHFLSI